jgi:hypothetical protein
LVGDASTLRLFDATSGSPVASEPLGDPHNCTPYTSRPTPHAAIADTVNFNCSSATSEGECPDSVGCRWIPQRSSCTPQPFYSTCTGNIYFFAATARGGSEVVVCSAIGQCELRSARTLALLSDRPPVSGLGSSFPVPGPDAGPRGWYCGTPSFTALVTQPNDAAVVAEQYCPVWRYGPVDTTTAWRYGDSAVGVVASDPGIAGAPDVLYMATSREEERDNGLLAAPQWAGGNRADELTKRGLGGLPRHSILAIARSVRTQTVAISHTRTRTHTRARTRARAHTHTHSHSHSYARAHVITITCSHLVHHGTVCTH